MRKFIIAQFDLIIGPSYNSEDDLINEFGSSGNNFIQAFVCDERGKYNPNKTRNEILSQLNIPKNSKIILCMNSLFRKNKGVDDLLDSWISRKKKNKNIYFVLTGIKPRQYEDLRKDGKFRFIEGKLSEQCLSNLFSAINFLFLNYKSITNSGQFFLALNYSVPVIAPNLTFFDRHSNNKSAILFDKELELKLQIDDILESIDHGWSADIASMNSLNDRYNPKNSIKKISTYLNKLT